MSEKDPYSLDDFQFDDEGQNAVDPSIAPDQGFPHSNFPDENLEKTMLHQQASLEGATDVSEPFYAGEAPPLDGEGQSLGTDVLQLAPDVPVQLVAMIGRKPATVKDLLDLKLGDVVEFDRKPMDPIDLVVSGRVVAKAELVVVDGRLGVRVLKLFK